MPITCTASKIGLYAREGHVRLGSIQDSFRKIQDSLVSDWPAYKTVLGIYKTVMCQIGHRVGWSDSFNGKMGLIFSSEIFSFREGCWFWLK